MRIGKILVYSEDAGGGVIQCADSRKYFFPRNQWMATTEPQKDTQVTFLEGYGGASAVKPAHEG